MRWMCALVALALVLAPAPGLARGVQAQLHMDSGIQLYDAGEYVRAADEFEAGYRLEPDQELLYNWASAEFLAGRCETALTLFHRLDLEALSAEFATSARDSMAECVKKLPRPRKPRVKKPKKQEIERVTVVAKPWYRDVLGGALVGGGVASVLIGMGFYQSAQNHLFKAGHAGNWDEVDREVTTANQHQGIALLCTAAGTGLIVGGVLRYRSLPSTSPRSTVTLAVTGQGGFIGWGGTF